MLASPFRLAVMRELRGVPEPSLMEHVARLSPADLTVVEGYKWEPIDKLEVFRPALGKPALYVDDAHIVAVASDAPRPADAPATLAWLDLNAPGEVLAWLDRRLD